jgi:GDP-L-fucose synthase
MTPTDFYRSRKVLVTGGTGMIGVQVVRLLAERGAEVRVASLDAQPGGDPRYQFLRGDLRDADFCKSAVRGCDLVFHLAGIKGSVSVGGRRGASFLVPLLLMNTQVMEAARQQDVARYLYVSSIAVYPPSEIFREDDAWTGPPQQADRYAAWAKRIGELQVEAYHEEFGWDRAVVVRPANVFGPHDNFDPATAMVIPALIARAVAGENPLRVWGDGSAVRDFIFSRDCAEGMILAMERAPADTPINLGSGAGTPIREVVEAVLNCVGNRPEVAWDLSRPRGEPKRVMDVQRARSLLGFRTRTPLPEAIRETVEWYLSHRDAQALRHNPFLQPSALLGTQP